MRRSSDSAGKQPSVVTRVAAAQGRDEAMRQVLAASSTIKASAVSDADVVKKNQMGGGKKPVLLIRSTMCRITMIKSQNVVERHARRPEGHSVITAMMRDANRVNEVEYKNCVEQCVKHLPGNAGRLFLHENLWYGWSRRLSFVKKMAESDDMHKAKSYLFRSQSTMSSPRMGFYFKSKSGYVTEELGMCCCNKKKLTKIHLKNVMMMVLRGLSYVAFTDSKSTIRSKKVGRAVQESNVMDSISAVVVDTRSLRESRQMEIEFVNQLDV